MKKNLLAFSLIESSIALLIMGVLTTATLHYWKIITYKENIQITKFKARYVKNAVQGYVARHGFLPCAASNLQGLEQSGCHHGLVPYKALGINKWYCVDGFGKPFTFVVNRHLTLAQQEKYNINIIPIHLHFSVHPRTPCASFCRLHKYAISIPSKYHDALEGKVGIEHLHLQKTTIIEEPARIANHDTRFRRLNAYDYLDKKNQLKLIKNNKEISFPQHSIFNELPRFREIRNKKFDDPVGFFMFIHESYDQVLKIDPIIPDKTATDRTNADCLAWALISHEKKSPNHTNSETINLDCNDLIFWQSRFNLASLIKHDCTQEPIDYVTDKSIAGLGGTVHRSRPRNM